jgi:hypothetical protein
MPIKLRPYRPEYDQQVIELAGRGWTWAQIASELGINMLDWAAMVESQPSFAAAVEEADQVCWDWWISKGGELVRDPDSTNEQAYLWEAQMRFRFGDTAFRTGVKGPTPWTKPPAPPPRPLNLRYGRDWPVRR